jgi:geranylgeranyl pyrophosphate synthase
VAAIRALAASGDLTPRGRDILAGVLTDGAAAEYKSEEEVRWLQALIDRHGALGHAAEVSVRWARRAGRVLDVIDRWMKPSVHREFLRGLVDYVVARER